MGCEKPLAEKTAVRTDKKRGPRLRWMRPRGGGGRTSLLTALSGADMFALLWGSSHLQAEPGLKEREEGVF